jgi:hypothetical protein
MSTLPPSVRVLLSWIGEGIVGGFAFLTVSSVDPSPLRDTVLVLIWPLAIVAGTVVAWRWLGLAGRSEPPLGYVALTEIIDDGIRLADRMRQVKEADPAEAERAAWKVRLQDWTVEAERVLGEVAPPRLGAFRADLIFADTLPGDVPRWISSDLMDLDLRIERLRQIRATL